MIKLHTPIALCSALILAACASPAPGDMGEHAGHGAPAGASAPMEPRMQAMHEMHQKMMNAKTPEERNALMAEHMKAMKDGMGMMEGMGGMGAMHDGKGGPPDMAKHHQSMERRMDAMQMMMEMMMDRLPSPPAKP